MPLILTAASSPGPFPAFQCCTLKSRRAWYTTLCHNDAKTSSQKIISNVSCIGLHTYFTCNSLESKMIVPHSIDGIKPYVTPIVNSSTRNFVDLLLPMLTFTLQAPFIYYKIGNVTSNTRSSHSSACYIKNL